MPGEADRLRKLNEKLHQQNEILAERVRHLEAKRDQLKSRDQGLLDERFNEIFAPPRPLSIPERQEKLELRVHKLEGEVKRLSAAYDSWDLMRDNHASALHGLQREVAELHDKRRRWWQR